MHTIGVFMMKIFEVVGTSTGQNFANFLTSWYTYRLLKFQLQKFVNFWNSEAGIPTGGTKGSLNLTFQSECNDKPSGANHNGRRMQKRKARQRNSQSRPIDRSVLKFPGPHMRTYHPRGQVWRVHSKSISSLTYKNEWNFLDHTRGLTVHVRRFPPTW